MTKFIVTIRNDAAPDEASPPLYLGIDNTLSLEVTLADANEHFMFASDGTAALGIDLNNLLPPETSQATSVVHGAFDVLGPSTVDVGAGRFKLVPKHLPCALSTPITIALSGIRPSEDGKLPSGKNLILYTIDGTGHWTEAHAPLALSLVAPQPVRPEAAWAQSKSSVPTSEAEADDAKIASSRTFFIKNIIADPTGDKRPTFHLSFEAAASKNAGNAHRAFATKDEITKMKVSCTGDGAWQLGADPIGEGLEWPLTLLTPAAPATGTGQSHLVDQGASVAVTIDNIVTTLPPFLSALTIRYENIHRCPEGHLTLDVEKVPARPTILKFEATVEDGKPCTAPIYPGQEITLTWEAEGTGKNATPVRLVSSEAQREWDLVLPRKGSVKVHPTGGVTGQAIYDLSLDCGEPGVSLRRIVAVGAVTANLKAVAGPVTRGDEISLSYAMDYVGEYQLQPDVIPATRIPATKGTPRVADVKKVKVLQPTTYALTARGVGQAITRSVSVGIKPYLPEKSIYIAMDDAIWLIHPDLSMEMVVDHVETRTITDLVRVGRDPNNSDPANDLICWGHAYHAELHYAKLDGSDRSSAPTPAPVLSMARGWQELYVLFNDGKILQTSADPSYAMGSFQPVRAWTFNEGNLAVSAPSSLSQLRMCSGQNRGAATRFLVNCRDSIWSGGWDENNNNFGSPYFRVENGPLAQTALAQAVGAFDSYQYNRFLWIDGARNMLCLATLDPDPNNYQRAKITNQDCCPATLGRLKGMGLGVIEPMSHMPTVYWVEALPSGKSALFRFRWIWNPAAYTSQMAPREQIMTLPGTPGGNGIAVIV